MLITERHHQIVQILTERQSVTVAELRDLLNVSAVTIRNDLTQLAEQGRLVRTHGGATINDEMLQHELTFTIRQKSHAAQKRRIGELAASLLEPGESILLDASTTSLAVGHALKQYPELMPLTVVATGIWTAQELIGQVGLNVVMTGGDVRHTSGSITGAIAHEALNKINLHKAFLGARGITAKHGLTETHFQDSELKSTIVQRCEEVIAVVDGSKFGLVSLSTFAPIEQISRIVTDESAPTDMVAEFRARGIEVLIAKNEQDGDKKKGTLS